jgi:hypothetical protein
MTRASFNPPQRPGFGERFRTSFLSQSPGGLNILQNERNQQQLAAQQAAQQQLGNIISTQAIPQFRLDELAQQGPGALQREQAGLLLQSPLPAAQKLGGQLFGATIATPEREVAQREVSLKERKLGLDTSKFELERKKAQKALDRRFDIPDEKIIDQSNKLRNQFLDQSKNFIDIRDAFSRIQAVTQDPSPAGDIALIFNFMKVLDPTSVVKENEFATAANAGGVPARIRARYNRTINGKRLSQEIRQDIINQSANLFNKSNDSHKKSISEFSRLARGFGVPEDLAIIDIGQSQQDQQAIGRGINTAPPIPTNDEAVEAMRLLRTRGVIK